MKTHIVVILISSSVLALPTVRAPDAKFAADGLKYSRDFYSKVHLESPSPVSSPVSDLNAGHL
jgi:hypothetical protein